MLTCKLGRGTANPFAYPTFPSTLLDRTTNREIPTTPVRLNTRCPVWLHDMHVTATRDVEEAQRLSERVFWRTWHAQIDPIFWCYYDHEHGSYPGKYRPLFHYTAYKTPDASAHNGRQQESHNGFKTFAFPVPSQRRFVVMVVHMHLSRARRFTTRLHTVIFAVLDSEWELGMELQMKLDFGAGVATLANGSQVAISPKDEAIIGDLEGKGVFAGRRFNVLNVDSRYPDSVDRGFKLHAIPSPRNVEDVLEGIYEQWSGPLNSCSKSLTRRINRGFRFDARDPSTALRYVNATSDASMQRLRGSNVKRFINIADNVEVGPSHCHFDGGDVKSKPGSANGVFYTDPYFVALRASGGRDSVRQYIRPGFKSLRLRKGILPVDVWYGHLHCIKRGAENLGGRRSENIEHSVNRYVN